MTAVLSRLLGRLPIGWLQLIHNRARLAAALAGVAFANILVFMQLGFLGGLMESIRLPYLALNADILIMAPDANTLSDGGTLPRRRIDQALAVPGVAGVTPVYIGEVEWAREDGESTSLRTFGIDPEVEAFRLPEVNARRDLLAILDVGLIDRRTRKLAPEFARAIEDGAPYSFEAAGRTLSIEGVFTIGAGFDADGFLIVSDQTFLQLFPKRRAGGPNHLFVTIENGADPEAVVGALRKILPARDSLVRTTAQAAADDQAYQATEKPTGVVFGFGVIIGVLVGIIIVYQVLSTDVADHLPEYATFKAIGYAPGFFLGIVFEEALILAILGFIPGLLISLALYGIVSDMTGLPIFMDALRAVIVLVGTVAMCSASGAFATRRLAHADPADLF